MLIYRPTASDIKQPKIVLLEDFMAIEKELLEILACPKCKGAISLSESGDGIVCEGCRLVYPIKDGIPVMLIDEATELPAGG